MKKKGVRTPTVSKTKNSLKKKKNKQRTHTLDEYGLGYLANLKYKITAMAITSTVIIAPIVHLFLSILLEMFVIIFLLRPMLSSTPCIWTRNVNVQAS